MLRLGFGLRLVGAGPGAPVSARLPSGAEMPKRAGATTKGKDPSKGPERSPPPAGPVAVDAKGCVTIAIHAKPGSRQNAVTDLTTDAVSVAIAAPPSEGEANAELCRYLCKVLGLRKSDVVLDKISRIMHHTENRNLRDWWSGSGVEHLPSKHEGGKSREKMVKLLASTTPEEILEKLKKEAEKK
ncbi:UPF0235 protein C15orf40 homolog isoform X1 [Castor canadensis]|uniref:UPF0235 protein C15orf40 homolog isoform X1 n=1 Tax=Castor canadensis TaxID=51338 RepID=A0AC58LKH1_CASCN